MDKDPSSVMDIVDVGGTFCVGRTVDFSISGVRGQAKPFGVHKYLQNRDCWSSTTHLMFIHNDVSSLIDTVALLGTNGDCIFENIMF